MLGKMEMDTDIGLISLKQYMKEQAPEKPYKLLILSHDDPLDPNETAPMIKKEAEKLGITVFLAELMGCYMEDKGNNKLVYSYPVDTSGRAKLPSTKEDVEYEKPFEINPDDTLVMIRGLNPRDCCQSWWTMARTLESSGYKIINSVSCNEICNDKWYNQQIFQQNGITTPKTVLIRHKEGAPFAADKLGAKYPIILKSSIGSQGIGVILIESEKALHGISQLLYRENEYIDILLQEYIKTDYDVRVIVVAGKVLGAMKRPIIEGDFRSNVSQGSEPETHELTELERQESIKAAEAVGGDIVGVDFIPAKDREKQFPYFIEVNSAPGLIGIEKTIKGITSEVLKIYMNRDNWT